MEIVNGRQILTAMETRYRTTQYNTLPGLAEMTAVMDSCRQRSLTSCTVTRPRSRPPPFLSTTNAVLYPFPLPPQHHHYPSSLHHFAIMEAKVRSFNNLPRSNTVPSGALPNHWVFGVCHVDMHPSGDLVLAVNPGSGYLNHAGPAQILPLPTTREKAEATIPYLLDAFVNPTPSDSSAPTFAPWTWSTLDPDMAQAIEECLKKHDVKPALCEVGVCTAEERDTLEAARARLFGLLSQLSEDTEPDAVGPGDSTKCHGCGMSRECFFQPLRKCARCGEAFYHSRECQKKHWKHHKPTCRAPGTTPSFAAHDSHSMKAPTDPEARALMSSLRLEGHPNRGGTACASPSRIPAGNMVVDTVSSLPLYRLILTGQDTPEKMRLLFGPQYESTLKEDHEKVRIECLLDPPPGSPWHVLSASMNDPSLVRSLRPATEAEKRKVEEVREIQALIRQRVGAGKSPSSADMQAILKTFGPNWVAKLSAYTLATNTMDQGVPAGGYRGF